MCVEDRRSSLVFKKWRRPSHWAINEGQRTGEGGGGRLGHGSQFVCLFCPGNILVKNMTMSVSDMCRPDVDTSLL